MLLNMAVLFVLILDFRKTKTPAGLDKLDICTKPRAHTIDTFDEKVVESKSCVCVALLYLGNRRTHKTWNGSEPRLYHDNRTG